MLFSGFSLRLPISSKTCNNKDSGFVSEIIKREIANDSLITDFPDECAEVFLLLLNVWCDPAVFECDGEKLLLRLRFLQHMMKAIGIDNYKIIQ